MRPPGATRTVPPARSSHAATGWTPPAWRAATSCGSNSMRARIGSRRPVMAPLRFVQKGAAADERPERADRRKRLPWFRPAANVVAAGLSLRGLFWSNHGTARSPTHDGMCLHDALTREH